MSETSAVALWDFESQDFGQVSLKAGETVIVQDEQDDGWCTVEKKGGEMGFVPTAFLDKSKGKRKGTLFAKKKGSSDPAPEIPPFGSSSKKKDGAGGASSAANKGTRRFATRRGGGDSAVGASLGDLSARYGGAEEEPKRDPTPEPAPAPVPEEKPAVPVRRLSGAASDSDDVLPKNPGPAPSPGAPAQSEEKRKVGKLNNQWAAKQEPEPASSGPKKIVVKKKAAPPKEGQPLAQSLDSSGSRIPSVPPPKISEVSPVPKAEGKTSPRRNTTSTPLVQSTPALPAKPAQNLNKAGTVRMEQAPKQVPQETLEELTKMNDRRTNIMREIYETEKTYVRSLKEICDNYITAMKDSKWKDLVPRLFSNVQMILQINEELLGGLAELISSWDTTKSLVGPIFQKMAPFMRLYNTYGNSYNDAMALLIKAKEKDDFVQFLQSCRGTNALDLEALLIQPVQRIPRYRLLLEDLLKNTPSMHPDRENIESSLTYILDVANNVNESIRATEQSKKIAEQTGLQKYIAPHRKLLNEQFFSAKVSILGGESVKGAIDVACYLFNDLLVMFFAKVVKIKDQRRHDFTELAWPAVIMWPGPDGKTSFKITGPGMTIVFASKEKDNVTGQSQVSGFLQKVTDVCNEAEKAPPAGGNASGNARPANVTAGCKYGTFHFEEGISYVGEWKNGLPHGRGVQTLPGGLRVEGAFEDGQRDGECTLTYPTGEVFKGAFTKDVQHGPGQIIWPNGDSYNGYWLDGRRDGDGTFVCAYFKYVGSWNDGFMDGEGKLTFNGGGAYEGKFKEGKMHGDGVLLRANGGRVKGTWIAGSLEGEGEETYPESSPWKTYTGSFHLDKREGPGTMIYRDGSQYKGDWKEGSRHGRGILTCPSRPVMRYEGMWAFDKFEGKGEIFFSTKDRYVGAFSGGNMHGAGVYYYANGTQVAGEWKQGVRQRKLALSRSEGGGEKFDLEITSAKDHGELGDAKLNGKLISYFVTPSRPELDQTMLEQEILPEAEHNMITGAKTMRGSSSSSPASAATLTVEGSDSPSVAKKDRPRSSSILSTLKGNKK